MLFADKQAPYLRDFQTQAEEWHQRMEEQMQQAESVREELKAYDPMGWQDERGLPPGPERWSWRNG